MVLQKVIHVGESLGFKFRFQQFILHGIEMIGVRNKTVVQNFSHFSMNR